MLLRLATTAERLRSSLFFEPMLFVVGAIALGFAGVAVDDALVDNGTDLPLQLTSTVESARAVLSTVAGATITVAGIAFSVSLLIIQLASSQYSPRVVPGLFRDPFNKRVMGIVVGTFAYCLVVLRAVRSPLEEGTDAIIPNLSVALAAVLGITSILAIVAFINHSAHSMDVSRILHTVTEGALDTVRSQWRESDDVEEGPLEPSSSAERPPDHALVVDLDGHGWIQTIDEGALVRAAEPGGVVRLEISVGRYAVAGTPLCTIWPPPRDADDAVSRARRSVVIGESRTSPEDVALGVRQLADVALKALSPGINDPTTAQDAVFHLGTLLRETLGRRPPPARRSFGDRTLLESEALGHEQLIDLAFDEIRLAASDLPTVSIYLLEVIHLLVVSLGDDDLELSGPALLRQSTAIRDGVRRSASLLPLDIRRVDEAYDQRFAELSPGG